MFKKIFTKPAIFLTLLFASPSTFSDIIDFETAKKHIMEELDSETSLLSHNFEYFKKHPRTYGECTDKKGNKKLDLENTSFEEKPTATKFRVQYLCTMFDEDDQTEEVVYLIIAEGEYWTFIENKGERGNFILNTINFCNI